MSKDMVPGPANIGIASGVKDISERVLMSFFTPSFFIPLCSANFPVSKAKPEEVMISPPAIFSEFKLIPKKPRTYFPAKKEIKSIIRTLKDVERAIFALSGIVFSLANPTKTGTVPRGFIIENRAPKVNINNSICFLCKDGAIRDFMCYVIFKYRLSLCERMVTIR